MSSNKAIETNKPLGVCPACQGKGVIVSNKSGLKVTTKCIQCRGSGQSSGGLQRK